MSISFTASTKVTRNTITSTLVTLALTGTIGACGTGSSPRDELGANQEILTSCDPAKPPASLVEIDGTGSSASDAITAERMAAVESIATRTAVCSGRLKVLVFSASSAATTVLFDDDLKMPGATDNARLKRVPEATEEVMEKVRAGYGPAIAALPQGGSDITAQYRLAAEWTQQLGGSYKLGLVILSDGFQNVGVDLGAKPLGKDEAAALAGQVALPQLAGASVTVAGLGRVAEGTPPSSVVEGLVHYYDALCAKTAAATCVSVTDYATESR